MPEPVDTATPHLYHHDLPDRQPRGRLPKIHMNRRRTAFGKPVNGSDVGGIPELVLEGKTSAPFYREHSDELADILTDYERRRGSEVAAKGRFWRAICEAGFAPDGNLAKWAG